MRYLPLALVFILLSCSNKRSVINKYLNAGNLPAQQLTINVNADTSLLLLNGTRLTIPAGSLKTKNGDPAKLIAKEALTLQQIFVSGLATESDGKPLRSGGMLFLDAAPGEYVEIMKPLTVEIPTPAADTTMQLYKGEVNDDGSINWVRPEPLQVQENPAYTKGQQLFMQSCASCHFINKDGAGPALFGAEERIGDMNIYYKYVNNPPAMTACNPYFQDLQHKYGNVMMTGFPNLTREDIDAISYYINKEGGKQNGAYIGDNDFGYDSCDYYSRYYQALIQTVDSLQRQREEERFGNVNTTVAPFTDTTTIPFTAPVIPVSSAPVVTPGSYKADYYQFTIDAFGWNNVDVLEGDDVKDCELVVNLSGKHAGKNEVFLVIPAFKIFMRGGFMNDSVNYAFKSEDGKIPLKENLDAYIFVIGESPDSAQLFFGATRFTTSLKQKVGIQMEAVTTEQLTISMKAFNFTDMNFSVNRTYTRETIKTVEEKAMQLLKKIQRCNCLNGADTTQTYVNEINYDWMYNAPPSQTAGQ
jgi:hypothetical protein